MQRKVLRHRHQRAAAFVETISYVDALVGRANFGNLPVTQQNEIRTKLWIALNAVGDFDVVTIRVHVDANSRLNARYELGNRINLGMAADQ